MYITWILDNYDKEYKSSGQIPVNFPFITFGKYSKSLLGKQAKKAWYKVMYFS